MLPLILKYPKTSAALALGVLIIGSYAAKRAKEGAGELAADLGGAINPTNPDNIFNRAFNETTRAITGNPNFSFGSWLFDVLNPDYDKDYYETPLKNPAKEATRSPSAGPMPNLSDLMIP